MAVVALAVGIMLSGCGDNKDGPVDAAMHDTAKDTGPDKVARGRYIMNTLGACSFCHTPLNADGSRNMNKQFAGWKCDEPGGAFLDIDPDPTIGCLSPRNLTNDPTGLMNRTDDEIKNAIRNGVRTDGKRIVPIMPYYLFHNMSDDDVDAIVAYLRTVPGVNNLIPANQPPWDSINNDDTTSPLCNGGTCTATPVPLADIPMPDASFADQASAMRGRYLAGMVGLCIDCHTPDHSDLVAPGMFPPLFPNPLQTTKAFSGGRVFLKEQLGLVTADYPATITTRNLTPDATGLMGWTHAQISTAIAQGKDRDGKAVCAATHGSMISPYAGLEQADLDDITNYLQSLTPVANNTGMDCQGPTVP
jgi:mono/diheme cytochrome c family protein